MNVSRQHYRLSLIVIIVLGGVIVGPVSAADLVKLSIASAEEAALAESIFDSALARRGNNFVVSADETAISQLARHSLAFTTLLTDVDPSQLYWVYPPRRGLVDGAIDLDQLGPKVEFGDGRLVMQMSRAAAASLAVSSRVEAIPLSRRNVPFKYLPPATATAAADNFLHDSLATLVIQDSIYAYNRRLEEFYTRYVFTDSIDRARDWLVERFESFGYTDVTIQPFWHSSWAGTGYGYNVIAVKPGYIDPDQVVLIGAHYDSYTRAEPWICAPGADDDGSGTALVLESARVLAGAQLRKTIIFMAFSAEEQWMYGSGYAADRFYADGTRLEVMFNYDMVGYTADAFWDLNVHSVPYDAYRALTAAAALRNTGLGPVDPGSSTPGDNYPFEDLGYPTVRVDEADFNDPNYHMESDLTSALNFPYMTDVTRMAVVSLAIVADLPFPITSGEANDLGDGERLRVSWQACSADCNYWVFWGTESGVYADSGLALPGECEYTIAGLEDDVTCYYMVVGETPDGSRALYGVERSGTPRLYPYAPSNLVGSVLGEQLRLSISWDANQELDFSHYNIYRRIGSVGALNLYRSGYTGTSFTDNETVAHVGYEYSVTAVDYDGNESEPAVTEVLFPASFDGGPVIADGFTQDHFYDPDQAWQEAWLDTVLGGIGFGVASSDEHGGPVTLAGVGQYSSLFWIDDDVIIKNIAASEAALNDFAANNTNMFICGYRTWVGWSPQSVPTNHLLYREFGLSYYTYIGYFDFVGAHGENGWPSVQIDPTRGMREWRDIPKLTPRSGATVIGTFDSFMDLPDWEGKPVGLAYESANGKRVLLSFPLYYLTPASAQALMAKVIEYFGVTGHHDKGDLDHSGTIDIVDLVILLDHLFISLRPLSDPAEADMDGRPGVSIGDAFYLINYLFLGGPAPVPGTG